MNRSDDAPRHVGRCGLPIVERSCPAQSRYAQIEQIRLDHGIRRIETILPIDLNMYP